MTPRPDAPILLATKLHAPVVPPQTVMRERLFARLSEGRGRRLSLVACPAGFGKSTLLTAWREQEAGDRSVAWVTLDEGDNDAIVLWAHVIEALGRACPAMAHEVLAATLGTAPILDVVLPRLVNELVEQGEVVLVLDDFHRLSSESARESVAWFIDHLSSNVQVVVATRTDPALPLGALRARGQLLELRADELRFTTAEADEFMNGRLGLDLAAGDLDLLVSRTEGWPAGMYLAALSLAGKPDRHSLVRAFDGSSAHVVDFLSSEVLASYDADVQSFMTRTSVLERLCPELCDAVLGQEGSAATLESLARTNLFLIPLDDRRHWFRFHHLLAQILRLELERQEPQLVAGLHRRAYEWHRELGTADEAIHHAVAAGAFDEAGQLIAESWIHYTNAGRSTTVLDWLATFPPAFLDTSPRLLLVKAWVSALRAREGDMKAAVARVREIGTLEDGPLPDGLGSLESSLSLLCAAFAWGDVSAIIANGTRSEELEGPGSPWRAVATWSLGWGYYCSGELETARRWLEETTRIAPPSDQWIVAVAAQADLSLIAGLQGRTPDQVRLAAAAVDLARQRGLLDACEVGEVHTALGSALAAEGRLEAALPELERGVLLRRRWRPQLDLVDALIPLGATAAALGDHSRAADLFAEAERVLATCPDPGVLRTRLADARRAAGAPAGRTAPVRAGGALSDRELTVLRLLGSGLTEREIGAELHLSFNTVHSHVKSIYRKLLVSSRADAVARARGEGLI